jgi:hypothetical protein
VIYLNFVSFYTENTILKILLREYQTIFYCETMNLESIIIVFIAGVVELWLAIPLGFLLDVNPIITTIVAASGAILAAACITVLGENLRNRFLRWRYGDENGLEKSRLYKIWNKYGVIGLGLTSPLLFGAPLGAAVGITLGAEKNRLLLWMSIGIVIWSVGLSVAGIMGLLAFETMVK